MSKITVDAIRILLIEDDEEDVLLAQRALAKANIWNPVDVVRSGQEAMDFLYHRNKYTDPASSPRPGMIFLDLSLPGIDGHDVLDRISGDADLKQIPLAIVSTSDYEKDIEFGRRHGVQHYIIKPVQPENLIAAIGSVQSFRVILGNIV